jgi:hypothetical protein
MIKFSIHGNGESPTGNPQSKARFTGRQYRSQIPGVVKYQEWLEHVRAAFFDAVTTDGRITVRDKFLAQHLSFIDRKPLHTGDRKCRMQIFITWGSKTHADPENVFGSIADALFEQDKFLSGEFDFDERIGTAGRVDVCISIDQADESERSGSRVHPRKGKQVEKQ